MKSGVNTQPHGRLGDGFFPGKGSPEDLARSMELVRATAKEHGRDPDAIELTAGGRVTGAINLLRRTVTDYGNGAVAAREADPTEAVLIEERRDPLQPPAADAGQGTGWRNRLAYEQGCIQCKAHEGDGIGEKL